MLKSYLSTTVVALAAVRASASILSQVPFGGPSQFLSSDSSNSVRILTHESHPDHSLTIKPHYSNDVSTKGDGNTVADICPGATSGYTGYLNSGSKHFYFAYFESKSKPKDDPLVLWLNGGPGCSSMMGLFMELGPCIVNEGGESARENPDSWTNAASVFFLDQPIGVGFSYSSNGSVHGGEGGTFAASEDIYAFMRLWYKAFPESRTLPFSIAGESYGGHYIPVFAEHINQMNKITGIDDQIPLESVMIGNGIFSDLKQASSYYDIPCTNVTGIGPLLDESVCKKMAAAVPRCEYLLKACHEFPDPLICRASAGYCANELENPYFKSGLNYYDISKPCEGYLCYPIIESITKYLRTDKVREAFGVDKAAPQFEGCSNKVGREFQKVNDFIIDTRPFVAALLNTGIRVMIYVGTYDWICNFVGNERVFGSLKWDGLPDFRYQQENNKQVWDGGLWWESGLLRYVRINGAGHMVPHDKPVEALKLFKAWLDKKPL
ncbi:alpha/beta-Hydrolase [Glarea lozoyensis ATCC 20868]|uniref:Carboxypeptidase n=1 Tax=Glarea lozoyensis (strain ATCC 20868 / MF5171) TaxID=1116229 RepID=S3DGJ1_GLAL2|nr:alpha/beta-Hydrolase [Glarea lozoyensis ATCC 20868]EPE31151.1 alpha/beta-Hydrolase [Glarea lozoyensis ATCC 20868]